MIRSLIMGCLMLVLTSPAGISYASQTETAHIQSYRQAIAANPEDVIAYFNLGLALYQTGNQDEARQMLEKCIRLKPHDKVAHTQVDGPSCQILGSIYFSDKKNPRKAIHYLEKSLKYIPNDPETFYALGLAYQKLNNRDKALDYYNKTIAYTDKTKSQNETNLYECYFQLGRINAEQNQTEEAIKNYKLALATQPGSKDVMENLALIYHQQKDTDRTIAILEELVKIDPMNFNANYMLGLHFYKKKMYTEMVEAYNRAVQVKPDLADAHYNLGMAYYYQTRYDLAVEALQKTVEINPKDSEAFNLLGQAQTMAVDTFLQQGSNYLTQERYLEAAGSFEKVLKIDQNNHKAKVYLEDAKGKLKKMLAKHLVLAERFIKKGRLEDAYQEYELALKVKPDSSEAKAGLKKVKIQVTKLVANRYQKAKLFEKRGEIAEAARLYEQCLKMRPNYKPAQIAMKTLKRKMQVRISADYKRANNFVKSGKVSKAVKQYKKMLQTVQQLNYKTWEKKILVALTRINAKRNELLLRYLNEGKQSLKIGNQMQAKKAFNRVLDLEPHHREANQYIMKLTGSTSEAKVNAERIKETYYRGVDFYVKGKIEEAILEWEKVVRLDPENEDAVVNIKRAKIKLEAIRKLTGDN